MCREVQLGWPKRADRGACLTRLGMQCEAGIRSASGGWQERLDLFPGQLGAMERFLSRGEI